MKLVDQSACLLAISNHKNTMYNYEDPYPLMEFAGRTCYKSRNKSTKDSAKPFVEMLKSKEHTSVLEHSWEIRKYSKCVYPDINKKYLNVSDSTVNSNEIFVAGNAIAFQNWKYKNKDNFTLPNEDDIYSLYKGKKWKMFSATLWLITNRAIANELERHRRASYAQESTRYVRYSPTVKEIEIILPKWIDVTKMSKEDMIWFELQEHSENTYYKLIDRGWTPEKARGVLTLDLKTEVVVSMTWSRWMYTIGKRCANDAHPQIIELMNMVRNNLEYYEKGLFVK